MDVFLEALQQEEERIHTVVKEIILSPSEEQEFQQATHYHICREELGVDRVRDHCYLTGKFREGGGGGRHNACNFNFQFTGRIPVILHNLRGYDSHLIMQGAGEVEEQDHQLHSKQYGKVYFLLDWPLGFSGLASVHECLFRKVCFESGKGDAKFHVLKRFIEASKVPLLLRKGVYPYDYMDDMSKFQDRRLPPKEAFVSHLTEEHIRDEGYKHKQCLEGFNLYTLTHFIHTLFLFFMTKTI